MQIPHADTTCQSENTVYSPNQQRTRLWGSVTLKLPLPSFGGSDSVTTFLSPWLVAVPKLASVSGVTEHDKEKQGLWEGGSLSLSILTATLLVNLD